MQKIACEPQVGADPEVFLANQDDVIVPCVGIIKGTKEKPWTPDGYEPGYAMQEDNVMCEFNIPPSLGTGRDGYYVLKHGMQMVKGEAIKRGLRPKWGIVDHKFTAKQLTSKQAQTIGCEGDNDAYTGGASRTMLPDLTNWRSCGGHIHLGGDFKCPDFVAALFAELYIGLAGDNPGVRRANERQKWYGQPGIYRSKPYGIEYRSLSSAWLASNMAIERTFKWSSKCAKWLTRADSLVIQKAFRAVPWTELRAIMMREEGAPQVQTFLIKCKQAGVPL